MAMFKETGVFIVPPEILADMRTIFIGGRLDDESIAQVMQQTYKQTGELIDPHTAVACAPRLLKNLSNDSVHVSLACAHPAKFPGAVKDAVGVFPALPDFMGNLFEREERYTVLENDQAVVKAFVEEQLGQK
ncbi:MAG: hypothetical protein AAGA46_16740 [Cyanobacteria bacterium P01_F01_bin.13]